MNEDTIVIEIPPAVDSCIDDWLRDYDTMNRRGWSSDPESHEQHLMETARLAGSAGALFRLLYGQSRRIVPPAVLLPRLGAGGPQQLGPQQLGPQPPYLEARGPAFTPAPDNGRPSQFDAFSEHQEQQ